MVKKYIKEFEEQTGAKVIYVTLSGSKLYGTDTPNSDTNYKGIFIPSVKSVLLKEDPKVYTRDTNNTKEKNSKDDVDFALHSIYQFLDLIQKSETGTIDMFFSMFSTHNIVYEDKDYTSVIRSAKKYLLNKNMKSFIGYVGQTKKYGIKGARYDELEKLVNFLNTLPNEGKHSLYKDEIEKFLIKEKFKYISYKLSDGPRTARGNSSILYLSVLSKLFSLDLEMEYMKSRINELYNQFGNRTKTIAKTKDKTDFKALSHSLRIAEEVKELLETNHINFPLKNAKYIREIKEGNVDFETVVNEVEKILKEVDDLLEKSNLPEESDRDKINILLLNLMTMKFLDNSGMK